MLYLSPLLGAGIATIIMAVHTIIALRLSINDIFTLLQILPLSFLIYSIISYVFSIPIGSLLIKRKNYYGWSDGFFLFIALICGSLIGLVFSILNYNVEKSFLTAFFIWIVFSLGAVFNASFYIALKKELDKLKNSTH